MKTWLYEHRYGISLFLLAAALLLPFLGLSPLTDPDEPVYGQTAKEMLAAGDWLSPRIFGNFWYDKPPLFYWLEMASYSLFGISDYTSRLPSAFMGILTVLYLYWQGAKMFTKEIAYAAALVLLTSLGFVYIGNAAVTDMTLMLALTVTMISFYRRQYYVAYIFCGLSLLAKGPIGYGFPALIMLLYIIIRRHWSLLRTMKIPQGILLAFLVGLPWYYLMYRVHGDAFIDTFIGFHNITRFTAPEHPGQNHLFFFIPVLLAFMLPWSGAIVPAIGRFVKNKGPHKDALSFCLIWAAFIFVFFSISQTQLVTYIAPMFPPTAFLIGWYMNECRQEGRRPILWIVTLLVLGLALLGSNAIPLNPDAEHFQPVILGASLILGAIAFVPAVCLYRRRYTSAVIAVATGMFIFAASAFGYYLPSLEDDVSSHHLAQKLSSVYDGTSLLLIDKFNRPGVAFYSDLYGREWNHAADSDFSIPEKTYYVMSKKYYDRMAKLYPVITDYTVLAETPTQVILINHL